MACNGTSSCSCGCCAGTSVQTPQLETNLPGQSSLAYRAGTWATFKESMLARLSSSDYPALSGLKTRDDDDFTVALLDATSVVLDILTFYSERLANESYLGTAIQQRSLVELSRLIGYQPSPGVSASTYLAFTLKAAPGIPVNPSNPAITIPQGTQVQSVPAQGQTAQTFETFADIQAKSDWNALDVLSGVPWSPPGSTGIYLAGTNTQLKPGDALLILGVEREQWDASSGVPSEQWDVVIVNEVTTDSIRNYTYATWGERWTHETGNGMSPSSWSSAKIFALRQRAALFGHNAPNPNLFVNATTNTNTSLPSLINDDVTPWQWLNYQIASAAQIDLDSTYQKVVDDGWFALTRRNLPTQYLTMDHLGNLWISPAPAGSMPQTLIDSNLNWFAPNSFQALSASQIFVLDNSNNLWFEQPPFGTAPPPSRVQVDATAKAFQAITATEVFVLGTDGNLWLEQGPFGSVPPPRVQVDSNITSFDAVSTSQVYVLDSSGNLRLDQAPFGSSNQLAVDSGITAFQAISATQVFALDNNANLWLYNAPFGNPNPPGPRTQVDQNVFSFDAVSASQVYVLPAGAPPLMFETAPFGTVPPTSAINIINGALKIQAVSANLVLATQFPLLGPPVLVSGPFGTMPPSRSPIDALQIQALTADVAQVFGVERAATMSLSQFGLSAKVTELTADYSDPTIATTFDLPGTQVFAQSEQLQIAQQPLDYPLYGYLLDLQDLRPDLAAVTVVAVSGNRQKISIADGVTGLTFTPDDVTAALLPLMPGDTLTITNPAPLPINGDGSIPDWPSSTSSLTLNVLDPNGRPGTVTAALSDFELAESSSTDPVVSEYALVSPTSSGESVLGYPHTVITLQGNLSHCYDRFTTAVNCNVGLATQGQSVAEILGNGSASTPDQNFNLKQKPLTFIQAPTPNGRQSTLSVQANGNTWTEVTSLYNQVSSAQVFATLNQPGGNTEVLFGDGVEGATLPTGQNNIMANYRVGLGSSGNVAAAAITTLIDRPLGVSGVTNPGAATGGQDPDSIDDIRSNAPQTVMTLGRAVSITDYQSYAATFAGIAKAYALWIPNGPGRGVFLTVAGADGAQLLSSNPTLTNLVTSLQNYGNPLVPLTVVTFLETLFGITAAVKYQPTITTNAAQNAVNTAIQQALYGAFSFEQRGFGQGVSADEVTAVILGVTGVLAVNVTALTPGATSSAGDLASQGPFTLSGYNNWLACQVPPLPRPTSSTGLRICAYLPVASSVSLPAAAEILVLDPDPRQIVLNVMS